MKEARWMLFAIALGVVALAGSLSGSEVLWPQVAGAEIPWPMVA